MYPFWGRDDVVETEVFRPDGVVTRSPWATCQCTQGPSHLYLGRGEISSAGSSRRYTKNTSGVIGVSWGSGDGRTQHVYVLIHSPTYTLTESTLLRMIFDLTYLVYNPSEPLQTGRVSLEEILHTESVRSGVEWWTRAGGRVLKDTILYFLWLFRFVWGEADL